MFFSGLLSWLHRYRQIIVFLFVYLLVSLYSLASLLHNSRLGDVYYRASFESMYHGTAWRPFVYRILIPRITFTITSMTPMSIQRSVGDEIDAFVYTQDSQWLKKVFPRLEEVFPDKRTHYQRMVMISILYAMLWGVIVAMYKLGKHLFPDDNAIRYFAPILPLLLIPVTNWKVIYVYDVGVLFLSAVAYYCMALRRFQFYIIIFTLACLNKESSIFLLLFFIIWFWRRLNLKHYLGLVAVQIVIYAVIRYALLVAYQKNAGWVFEDYFNDLLHFEIYPRNMYHRLLSFACLVFFFVYDWQKKPLFALYILWLWPPMYLAYLLYGFPGEYRVFHDIMPLTMLLATHTLIASTGISKASFFKKEDERLSVETQKTEVIP
jgi:hypothetical protein